MHTLIERCWMGALVLSALALSGCAPPQRERPTDHTVRPDHANLHDYTGLDTSAGFRPRLSAAAVLCAQRAGQMDSACDQLTIFRVDNHTQEVYDNPPPADPDDAQATIAREAAAVPPRGGTYPARFWTEVARRAETDTGPVLVDFFTDGDNDDMTPAARTAIAAAARRLAANPHVAQVCLYGVSRENRAALHALFAPLGERRFHLFGPTEMTPDAISGTFRAIRR